MTVFVFNFKAVFADRVAYGRKAQTIRAHRKDGKVPRQGDTVKLYTGLRTRNTKLLLEGVVTDCFPVHIDLHHDAYDRPFIINGIRLRPGEARSFARLDGFTDANDMQAWFRETYGPEQDFEGFCVRWSSRQPPSRAEKHG